MKSQKRPFYKKSKKTKILPLKQLTKQFHLSDQLNYKNILLVRHYLSISRKIIPKRLNNLTAYQQRQMTKAIKNARILSLVPFVRLMDINASE